MSDNIINGNIDTNILLKNNILEYLVLSITISIFNMNNINIMVNIKYLHFLFTISYNIFVEN